jgi:hypothetical protein
MIYIGKGTRLHFEINIVNIMVNLRLQVTLISEFKFHGSFTFWEYEVTNAISWEQ